MNLQPLTRGVQRSRADGKGYDWVPANYTALR